MNGFVLKSIHGFLHKLLQKFATYSSHVLFLFSKMPPPPFRDFFFNSSNGSVRHFSRTFFGCSLDSFFTNFLKISFSKFSEIIFPVLFKKIHQGFLHKFIQGFIQNLHYGLLQRFFRKCVKNCPQKLKSSTSFFRNSFQYFSMDSSWHSIRVGMSLGSSSGDYPENHA